MPKIVSKLGKCESLTVMADSALVMERLSWALSAVPRLRHLRVSFHADQAGMSNWSAHCETLSRSMEDVTRFETFRVCSHSCWASPVIPDFPALPITYLRDPAYHGILFRLPLDCALRTAVHGDVSYAVVEKLIDRGANVNSVHKMMDGGVQSILSLACMHQPMDVIALLLDKGARDSKLETYDCFHSALNRVKYDANDPTTDPVAVLQVLYGASLTSWSRDHHQGGLLHFAMNKIDHITPRVVHCIVAVVHRRQPALATLSDRRGHTPLSLLLESLDPNPYEENEKEIHDTMAMCTIAKNLSKLERARRRDESESHENVAEFRTFSL